MDLQPGKFTVCALTYGDHTDLARRCFQSIADRVDPQWVDSVRIGFNDACNATLREARKIFDGCPVPVWGFEPGKNALKYPLMRKMFYRESLPVTTEYVMWFDDDSCIVPPSGDSFFSDIANKMASTQATVLGDVWVMPFQGRQQENIKQQSWYTGKPWIKYRNKDVMKFATGGWWTADFATLKRWSYPWVALKHNGGDTTLGEMLNQQGLNLVPYKHGLWINADDKGRNSKAKRRGESQRTVWYDMAPLGVGNQHDFEVKLFRLDETEKPVAIQTVKRIPGL